MNKYYFVNIGAEVIWHPVNSDEQKVMQICTSVSYPVENDTLVSLIFSDKRGSVKVKASELTPKLTDFNQGYWCALQDAVMVPLIRLFRKCYAVPDLHTGNVTGIYKILIFSQKKYGRLFVECFAKIQIILIGMVLIIQ